jgi:TonB family protein
MQQKSYSRYSYIDNDEQIQATILIPWDKYTAIGVGVSVLLISLTLLLFLIKKEATSSRYIEIGSVPTVILSFGMGDGTGLSHGNLTEEGVKKQGETPPTNLHDATTAAATTQSDAVSNATLDESSNIRAVSELSSTTTNKGSEKGDSPNNFGAPDGSWGGRGLGSTGTGKGAGYGFGDIDWGGGGNRWIVGEKVLPKFPADVNVSATIKLRFEVSPDGTVTKITPIQRADPRLEKAAIEALKKWRFNPIEGNTIMVGTIPLTFRLK